MTDANKDMQIQKTYKLPPFIFTIWDRMDSDLSKIHLEIHLLLRKHLLQNK